MELKIGYCDACGEGRVVVKLTGRYGGDRYCEVCLRGALAVLEANKEKLDAAGIHFEPGVGSRREIL